MGNAIIRGIKGIFNACGVEVSRIPPWQEYGWLRTKGIRTVLDIGANTGQFASQIHMLLPDAKVYSFEPLRDCFDQLQARMGEVPQFSGFAFALGDINGTAQIHRNDFTPSSSLLEMGDLHRQAFPYTEKTAVEQIEIRRLDDLVPGMEIVGNILTKIDVQGAEDKVIRGGESLIARSSVLIIETSFRPLYVGQVLFDGIYDMLRSKGFVFMGCEGAVRSPDDGSILQCDSIFIRTSEGSEESQ